MSNIDDQSFGAIDYAVFVGMLLVSTAIGVYYAWIDRNHQSNREFLMGGKKMGIIPVAISLMASYMTPIAIIGYPVEIYTKGTQFWLSVLTFIVATFVSTEIFLPIFYRMNLTSVNEYLYRRFQSNAVRTVASISVLLCNLPFLGVVLFCPSLALAAVTKLPVLWSVILIGVICTFYTCVGGLKAVIWTDVVQFVLMFAGMIAILVKGTIDAGGVSETWRKAKSGNRIQFFNMDFDIYSSTNFWTVMIGMALLWTTHFSINQMQVQRSCSLPNIRKAKASLYISMPGIMLLLSLSCYAGIVVYANNFDCDVIKTGQLERVDQLLPFFVLKSFGNKYPGIPGLFVACVFSSSLSTLSSGYNAVAAIVWEDFLKKLFPNVTDKDAVTITRLIAALIGFASIGVALMVSHVGTIFEATLSLMASQLGPLFALFVVGVFFPWGNAMGAIFGLFSGQILCLIITIGSMVNKRPPAILPSTTEGCVNITTIIANITSVGAPLETLSTSFIPHYSPEGLNTLYHLSPLLVPVIGFLFSLLVSIIVSLLSGGNNNKVIDPKLIHFSANKLYAVITSNTKHKTKTQFTLTNVR